MHWNACKIYDQLEAGDFVVSARLYLLQCGSFLGQVKATIGTERADQILRLRTITMVSSVRQYDVYGVGDACLDWEKKQVDKANSLLHWEVLF
jgi:hypothetical protein